MSCAFWLAEQAPSFHASLSCAQEVVHDSCDSLFAVSTLSPHAFLHPLNKRQKSPCSSGYVHKLSIILIVLICVLNLKVSTVGLQMAKLRAHNLNESLMLTRSLCSEYKFNFRKLVRFFINVGSTQIWMSREDSISPKPSDFLLQCSTNWATEKSMASQPIIRYTCDRRPPFL